MAILTLSALFQKTFVCRAFKLNQVQLTFRVWSLISPCLASKKLCWHLKNHGFMPTPNVWNSAFEVFCFEIQLSAQEIDRFIYASFPGTENRFFNAMSWTLFSSELKIQSTFNYFRREELLFKIAFLWYDAVCRTKIADQIWLSNCV